jgi:hypothetical protein
MAPKKHKLTIIFKKILLSIKEDAKYNFTYIFSYYPSVDGNWGGISDAKKNIFNGMIGMLQRKVRYLKMYFLESEEVLFLPL